MSRSTVALAAVVLLAVSLLSIGLSRAINPPQPPPSATAVPTPVGAYVGEVISCAGGTVPYVPPARAWHDAACTYIVASAFAYEASLTPGQTPNGDSDYIHRYSVQVWVYLPGGSQDRWLFAGAWNILGSGCVEAWIGPNGGRIAMLHLTCGVLWAAGTYTGAPIPLPPRSLVRTAPHKPLSNEEIDALTAIAVGAHQRHAPTGPAAATVPGGTRVGLSRWPDDPSFGKGVAGPGNAHLCIITTDLSSQWLYRYEHGMIHHVPPFHQKTWDAYLRPRHKKLISAYAHHRLTRAAQAWRKHQKDYRGIASKRHYARTAKRRDPFTHWRWRCGEAWVWSHRIKSQKAKCLK